MTVQRTAPNHRLLTSAHILEQTAVLATQALEHIWRELIVLDGYPATGGDGGPRSKGEHSDPTERIAHARYALTSQREQIRDDIEAVAQVIASLAEVCRKAIGIRAPAIEVRLCDGRSYEGAQLPWTPHSRDPWNGWHDPTCTDAADDSGLCERCRVRERRWRLEHGLQARITNTSEAA